MVRRSISAIPRSPCCPARVPRSARSRAAPATSRSRRSLKALQYAAEDGHPLAQWKLGRMYAAGDGVARDDVRAFDYFSRIAKAARRGQSVRAAVGDRRQRLRCAGALLPERHPEFEREVGSRSRARDAVLRRVLFRQCGCAIRSGPALSEGRRRHAERIHLWRALARARRAEGPASGPGACSARCCSTATACRRSARAA